MTTVNELDTTIIGIINDKLDFSKIELGKIELNIEEINLFELTQQVIDLFKHQADQKNIGLILNIDKRIPCLILADSLRLKQILINLLNNALKATSFGEIRLDIKIVSTIDNWVNLKFSIKDSGIGILKHNQGTFWDSFVQEDIPTTRNFGGTGVEGTISNKLLQIVNSKLELISICGEGSDFYFNLGFEIIKPSCEIPKNEVISNKLGQKISVLIVEDNAINRLLAKTFVKKIYPNSTIFEAFNGEEAIIQFHINKVDVILMDIQMPVMNGYEATFQIRNLCHGVTIPIIALTAGIMQGEKEKCLELGMNDYISKPFVMKDLEQILIKWIN
jgi:CheY-like chemotaxis protein